MNTSHPLQQAIDKARVQRRKAVIPFLTAGFPTPQTFWDNLLELDQAGADILEIGVPFSDPVADGPVIEMASRQALQAGISLRWILDGILQRHNKIKAPIVLMGYVNPFLQYSSSLDAWAKDIKEAGVQGIIIPDLPLEERDDFAQALEAQNLALIPLVAPNTTTERMRAYAKVSRGFVYVVSVLGITGGTTQITNTVIETLKRARTSFNIPIALGFGLHVPSQLDVIPESAQPDAVVLGSALLRHLTQGRSASSFISPWITKE